MALTPSIMVVGGDAELLERIGRFLEENGYAVRCAAGTDEAVSLIRQQPAELVIHEHGTAAPDRELIDAIRGIHARTRFILIGTGGSATALDQAARWRVVAQLSEPFKPEDLMYYVRGAFGLGETHNNRRAHNRYLFTVETHCILINPFDNSESRPLASLIHDVSRSGLSLITRQLLPVPAMLRLVIHLSDQTRPITMLARSISCMLTPVQGVYRLGAKFVGLLPPEMEEAIQRLGSHTAGDRRSEVFMGKSFREAVREWLAGHPDQHPAGQEQLDALARELTEDIGPEEADGD